MEKISRIASTAVPLPIENIDTDQIIPARFLKAVTKEGFGKNLFRDWRYDAEGKELKSFVLNNDRFTGQILVAGKNFGCGSSREHAAWALHDYGFRVVISSFFADIFKSNALNNGIIPITVTEEQLAGLFDRIEDNPDLEFVVELAEQLLTVDGLRIEFEIDAFKKECLLKGLDDLDYLVNLTEEIEAFERKKVLF